MDITLKDIGLNNTASIAVCKDSCFKIVPVSGGTRPREYYKPRDIESDYRELVKEYGSNNVKIFRELEVVISPKDDHREYLEYKREIMEMDEQRAARDAAKEED